MMDCKCVQDAIYRFVYGEGDEAELRSIKDHLDDCHECEKEAKIIGDILKRLKAASPLNEPLPNGCRERMLDGIRSSLAMENHAA